MPALMLADINSGFSCAEATGTRVIRQIAERTDIFFMGFDFYAAGFLTKVRRQKVAPTPIVAMTSSASVLGSGTMVIV